jgi:anti-sigma B factor antagonist
MKIQRTEQGGLLIAALEGRFDALSADTAGNELLNWLPAGPVRLVLDFAQVTYLSSAGLRVLFRIAKESNVRNGRLALCRLTPLVRQVIDLSGYSALVPIFDDLDRALASLAEAGDISP